MTYVVISDDRGALHIEPGVLGEARPNTRYVVEPAEQGWSVRPEPSTAETDDGAPADMKLSPAEWERLRDELSESLTAVWPQGISVVDVISEMRR